MAAAIKDLRAGDMVLHRGKPMYVQSVEEDGIHCIDILNSENKVIVPVTNMFGFNFVTKVVSLIRCTTLCGEPLRQPDAVYDDVLCHG